MRVIRAAMAIAATSLLGCRGVAPLPTIDSSTVRDTEPPEEDASPPALPDASADLYEPGDLAESVFVPPAALATDDDQLTIDSPAAVPARRAALIQLLWGAAGFPAATLPSAVEKSAPNPIKSTPIENLARVDRLVIDMGQGIKNEAFHFVPKSANGRLVIVHQGHLSTLDAGGLAEAIAALVGEGYGVLGALMPCYNSFACPVKATQPGSPHNDLISQITPPSGDVMKFFFEHLAISLHYLKTRSAADGFPPYVEFDMLGLSGGGWTTTLYAAIDPTITWSFPCSGGKPMYLRHCTMPGDGCIDGYDGDREQMYFPLYKHVAGYLDLYAMGAAGGGRRQVQVQIRKDGCCFGENQYDQVNGVPGMTWDRAVRAGEKKVQSFFASASDEGWYRYEIDETAAGTHVISPTTLQQVILADLDGDRRPVAAASAANVYARGQDELLWQASPDWASTGYPAVGTPSVIETGDDQDIFLRDPQSALVHIHRGALQGAHWDADTWPGLIGADPAGARLGDTVHAVAVGADSRSWHWSQQGNGAIVMEQIDAATPMVGPPALVATGDDQLDALIRRLDGGIQHVYWRGAGWASERASNGVFRGFPSAVAGDDGQLRVYARGRDDRIWEAARPIAMGGGGWTLGALGDKAMVPGLMIGGSPSASVDPISGEAFVVGRLPSGILGKFAIVTESGQRRWSYQPIDRPDGPAPLNGTASFSFSPVAVPQGIYARAVEGTLWFDDFDAGWSCESGTIH